MAMVAFGAIASPMVPAQAAADPCGPYDDVAASNPHCANIKWLTDNEITTGMAPRRFAPENATSREAIIAFLYRIEHPGAPAPKCHQEAFPDVPSDYLFCGEIKWAKDLGITEGYSDGKFKPTKPVSRGAAAAFIHRFKTNQAPQPKCTTPPFTDVPTSHDFCGYIQWMRQKHITSGMDRCVYGVNLRTSRSAMASFLKRMQVPETLDQECKPKPTRPTKQAMFSYGTLMKGQPASRYFDGTYHSYAKSSLKGADLYYSASRKFPYVVIGGTNTVKGEIYNLRDATAAATIKKIDAYERYNPSKPDSGQSYVRKQYTIQQGYTAWIYIAGPEQAAWLKSNGTRIPSGDWLRK